LFIKNYSPKIFGIEGEIVPNDGIEPQSMTLRLERTSDCDVQHLCCNPELASGSHLLLFQLLISDAGCQKMK